MFNLSSLLNWTGMHIPGNVSVDENARVTLGFNNTAKETFDFMTDFVHSVDWTQPWLVTLLSLHLFCSVFIVATRKHTTFQVPVFVLLLVACSAAPYINEWAAENWKMFAREQYFDSPGFFISMVYSGPIILNCLLLICLWLYELFNMMVIVKRMEFIRKQRHRKGAASSKSQKSLPRAATEDKKRR